jgi:DNA-binding CsgD family transcriptional regulator
MGRSGMPGPLQVIAVTFAADADFRGRVLDEVDRLQGRGVLRLLDMLFVAKRADGTIERVLVGDDEDFGALLASVVPLDGSGLVGPPVGGGPAGFDPSDAWALAESLVPGTALAFLLIEHGWAQPLFDAISETGGVMLGEGFLTPEVGLMVGAEVAAMEEATAVIAAAHAAESEAMLSAIAAQADAAEAIATAETIRAAAAASAIQALITAGLIEQAATHEAIEAVTAAGLVIAAADDAATEAVTDAAMQVRAAADVAAEAVTEDETLVRAADEAAAEAVAEDLITVSAADEAAREAVTEDAAVVRGADRVAADAVADAAGTVAAASITVGEARVLRYLSTPSTFAVIADKLGISRSAAKERASRAYRKLGVHSRSEAVTRARMLGLID